MPETETAGYHIVRSFLPAQTRVILKPSLWQDKWRVDGPLSFCHNRLRSDTRENRKNWSKKSIGKSQKKIIEEKDNFCFKKFVWLSGRFYLRSCYSLGLPCIFIIGDGRTLTMGGGKAGRREICWFIISLTDRRSCQVWYLSSCLCQVSDVLWKLYRLTVTFHYF